MLYNPRHPEGQLASLLHGLRWAFAQTTGAWVLSTLVDVPAVRVGDGPGPSRRRRLTAGLRAFAVIDDRTGIR